jgi:hypothetical protein
MEQAEEIMRRLQHRQRIPKFVQVYSRPFSHAARSLRAQKWARGKDRAIAAKIASIWTRCPTKSRLESSPSFQLLTAFVAQLFQERGGV